MLEFSDASKNPRSHLFIKNKTDRSSLNNHQIYLRKENSRKNRANSIRNDENREKFFQWIDDIQEKLKLSDAAFADRTGVSLQTRRLWKRRVGHYPSQRSYRALKRLERESRIEVIDFVFINGTRIG